MPPPRPPGVSGRFRLGWLAVVLTGLGLATGAWWWRQPAPASPPAAGRSVLLITIDTLRADALGAYGNRRAATPWMDRLAAAGTRFDRAYAHNVVTLPSHANLLAGRYPIDHGVRDNAGFVFPSTVDTLATVLQAHGYRTGAFVSGFPLDSRFGLDRGFDVYEDSFVDATARPAFFEQERPGSATVALARRWLDADPARPAFCWVHLYEPHYPYTPPEPWAARFAGEPYHGEVAASDAALQPLLEPLLSAGRAGQTVVVLTSDHGESLGEHGEATHGVFAYEATLRAPLVVYDPQAPSPRVIATPVRHVDVFPTVLEAVGVAVPRDIDGRSLARFVSGKAASEAGLPIYFEALSASMDRGWAPLRGVVRGRAKFIDLPIPELYDLAADPGETRNLAEAQPALARELRSALAPLVAADRGPRRAADSAETRDRLRSLGYVAGTSADTKSRYTPDDDPKRLIELDGVLQDVTARYLAGDVRGALARARELVARRPDMAVSLLYLAQIEREAGNLPAAIDALRRAQAASPANTEVASLLAATLTEAGRAAEAVDAVEPMARQDPADEQVLVAYALALARAGRSPEALAALARARGRNPSNAMLLVHGGTISLMAGDRAAAQRSFTLALEINPGVARAHSSLAMMAAEDGRRDEATAHWRDAGRLDSREYAKLFALASLLARQGRQPEARAYLELFAASAPPAQYARQLDQVRAVLARSR
jgi:arylsulfatase A-like enzyme/Flp pilus assembly protein TadD